jgi:hypothetical protein
MIIILIRIKESVMYLSMVRFGEDKQQQQQQQGGNSGGCGTCGSGGDCKAKALKEAADKKKAAASGPGAPDAKPSFAGQSIFSRLA